MHFGGRESIENENRKRVKENAQKNASVIAKMAKLK